MLVGAGSRDKGDGQANMAASVATSAFFAADVCEASVVLPTSAACAWPARSTMKAPRVSTEKREDWVSRTVSAKRDSDLHSGSGLGWPSTICRTAAVFMKAMSARENTHSVSFG